MENPDLVENFRHKGLPPEAGLHGHAKNKIHLIEIGKDFFGACIRIDDNA